MLKKLVVIFCICFISVIVISMFTTLISLFMDRSINIFGIHLNIIRKAGEIRGMSILINPFECASWYFGISCVITGILYIIMSIGKKDD